MSAWSSEKRKKWSWIAAVVILDTIWILLGYGPLLLLFGNLLIFFAYLLYTL